MASRVLQAWEAEPPRGGQRWAGGQGEDPRTCWKYQDGVGPWIPVAHLKKGQPVSLPSIPHPGTAAQCQAFAKGSNVRARLVGTETAAGVQEKLCRGDRCVVGGGLLGLQGLPSPPTRLEAVSLAGIFPAMELEEAAGPAGQGASALLPAPRIACVELIQGSG